MDATQWIGIGEFARMGGVSVKALRLYAELGLLRPAAVKQESRYRLYKRSQLSTLHRIRLLKTAGLSLAEIHVQLLHGNEASLQQIRTRLVKRAEEIQRQLSWIDAEMQSSSQPVIKHIPKLTAWSRRRSIDSYEQADTMLGDLALEVPAASRLVSGAVWHDCGRRSGNIDCEVFWLGGDRVGGRTMARELGPVKVASILHEGGDATILASYEAAHRWLQDNRYRIAGPNRELYLDASLTEIQFPIQ